MKKLFLSASYVTSAVVLALIVSWSIQKIKAQFVERPYSIRYREVVKDAFGNQVSVAEWFQGQRRDGVRVASTRLLNGITEKTLTFPAIGVIVSTNDANSNINTMGDGAPRAIAQPDATCRLFGGLEANGAGPDLLGFHTLYIRRASPEDVYEEWIAPDLSCMSLKRVHSWASGGVTVQEAVEASSAEPPASYFVLPKNPVETAPSVYQQIVPQPQLNGTQQTSHERQLARLDTKWQQDKEVRQRNGVVVRP